MKNWFWRQTVVQLSCNWPTYLYQTWKNSQSLSDFVIKQIKLKKQPKDDYIEFLHCNYSNFVDTYVFWNLAVFQMPFGLMVKAIKPLKMYCFKKNIIFLKIIVYSLDIFCNVSGFYGKAWCTARIAPLTDLNWIKQLIIIKVKIRKI